MPAFLRSKSFTLGLRSLLLLGLFLGGCSASEKEQAQEAIKTEQTTPGLQLGLETPRQKAAETDSNSQPTNPIEVETPASTPGIPPSPEKLDRPIETPQTSVASDATTETTLDDNPIATFSDIGDLAVKDDIINLNKLGIFEERGTEFKPYDSLTRGEYVIWLFKANNALRRETDHIRFDPMFDPGYEDLTADHPAYKYVQAFANTGFAVGYEDNTFRADQPITREEMIAIKVGLDDNKVHEPLNRVKAYLKFADAEQISPRYTGYIYHDQFGKDNIGRAFGSVKNFKPQQTVKRYEAAATLSKINGVKVAKVVENLER